MTTTVVGIDLSLTSTGLACLNRDGAGYTDTITSTGRKTDTLNDRAARLRGISRQVCDWVGTANRTVIEAPSYSSTGSGTWDRAGLWWLTVERLIRNNCAVAVVAPATRAKWATGGGRSDKAAVGAAMARLLPDIDCANGDEADALALAHMGAVALGYPVPRLDGRHATIPTALSEWTTP